MSQYLYYEFQSVDRPLDAKAQAALRSVSSRARISARSFVNHYEWGDLKADSIELLERHFDLHVHVANWGTRQFAMRLPRRLFDADVPPSVDLEWGGMLLARKTQEHVILDIRRDEIEGVWGDEVQDDEWLPALAPIREELMAGDYRLFGLLWLIGVEDGEREDDEVEPAPGIGALSPAVVTLADFLHLDPDLLAAAAGDDLRRKPIEPAPSDIERMLRGLSEEEKIALLLRVHAGDGTVPAELQRRWRAINPVAASPAKTLRTAGELRAAAQRIADEREVRATRRAAAEHRRREEEAAEQRAKRMETLAPRREVAWLEVDQLIGLRNPKGYDQATALITDLHALALQNADGEAFDRRLAEIRSRHAGKTRFIERLAAVGLIAGQLI